MTDTAARAAEPEILSAERIARLSEVAAMEPFGLFGSVADGVLRSHTDTESR